MLTDTFKIKAIAQIRKEKRKGTYKERKLVTLPMQHFEGLSDEELFILLETPNLEIVIDGETARYICQRAEAMGATEPKIKTVRAN